MKDLQTVAAESMASPDLQAKFATAASIDDVMAILKELDCEPAVEEVQAMMAQMGMQF